MDFIDFLRGFLEVLISERLYYKWEVLKLLVHLNDDDL